MGERIDSRGGPGKYKISLEDVVVPENKEVFEKGQGHIKRQGHIPVSVWGVCVSHLPYPIVYIWTVRLLPYLDYCKYHTM